VEKDAKEIKKILFFILPHTNVDLYWGGFSTHWGNKKTYRWGG
jgi:hypothetical protein